MWKQFRDLFGSQKATLAELYRIRDRLECLETAPVPDLPVELESRISALVRRDGDLQDGIDRVGQAVTELSGHIDGFDDWRKDLVIAVSEGIERTDRAERRIQATVSRARRQLAKLGYEDPGLESEAVELQLVDGERSEKGELPAVPTPVGEDVSKPSSVRGVSIETMRRARGY